MAVMVLCVVGVGVLIVGAEMLGRGAFRLTAAVGVVPLVIGRTVVACGTRPGGGMPTSPWEMSSAWCEGCTAAAPRASAVPAQRVVRFT
jgi:hypothetical protein